MNLEKFYPPRKPWSHKGQFGYVLIISGSETYSGSPVFNAVGALRSGADLTVVVGAKRAMDIAACFLPDIITYPLEGDLSLKHLPKIFSLAKNFDSLVIGCGLKRDKKTYKLIRNIIRKIDLPMVIDAEAIRAVAEDKTALKNKNAVLTPHSEEFRILTGIKPSIDIEKRKSEVKSWAKRLNSVILLKGHIDVISNGKKVLLNKTGSPYMTKGGFGDVLSGICASLLARGVDSLDAAYIAARINGLAGEKAVQKFGPGVLASDILNFIPKVIFKGRF